jgi:hypothetical protein
MSGRKNQRGCLYRTKIFVKDKIDAFVKSHQSGRRSKKLQMQVVRSEIPLAGALPSTGRSALTHGRRSQDKLNEE